MSIEFSNNFDSPVNKFEQMLKTNSTLFFDVQDFENIIHHYIDSGEINLAKKAVSIGLNQHNNNIQLTLLKSELLILDGDIDNSYSLLKEIESIEPNNQEVLIQKATIYSKKNQHGKAIKILEKSLNFIDDPSEVWLLLGMENMMTSNYSEAQKFFKKCLNIDPEDIQTLYNLIYCNDQLKEYGKSIEILNYILNINPYNESAWHELGKQYLKINKKNEALTSFEFAIISDEKFSGAYVEKAKILEEKGNIIEAIENYQITLQIEDESAYIISRIANCYEKIGNKQEARNYYEKSVIIDPSNNSCWNNLVEFCIKNKNYKKAILHLKNVIRINENNLNYWKKIAFVYKETKRYDLAEKAYKKAIELGDKEYDTWIDLIDSLLIMKNWNSATDIAVQAKKYFPLDHLIDYRLAGCLIKKGQTYKAKVYIENFIKNNGTLPSSIKYLFPEISITQKK